MNYEIGVFFYGEEDRCLGEIIAKDGNKWIAKYYNKCNVQNVSYGIAPESHVVIGRKKVFESLRDDIQVAEIHLKHCQEPIQVEKIYNNINGKVERFISKQKDLLFELERIQEKQMEEYSPNRRKQINCILKALKRNRKRLRGLYCNISEENPNITFWKYELKRRKELYDFAMRL